MDHQSLAVAVRWLHLTAMAAALGGAFLEQLFWAAAGVLVMTGVGNLGALGTALPAPDTRWGATFTAKLLFVGLLVAISLPRSLTVLALAARGGPTGSGLRAIYRVTSGILAVIAALAVRLAHG
jgi:hypothetical protein